MDAVPYGNKCTYLLAPLPLTPCLSSAPFMLPSPSPLFQAAVPQHPAHPEAGQPRGPKTPPHPKTLPPPLRLPFFSTLRTEKQVSPGILAAPVGKVTIVFMNVVGAQTLLAWNAEVARTALASFHLVVLSQLEALGG